MQTPKTALLTAFDKTGLPDFARQLLDLNFTLIASGGTAKVLKDQDLPVIDTASLVGDAILGHRVVTLSREIHAGVLATNSEEDNSELSRLGIRRIDLIYVNLYPLAQYIAEGRPKNEIIENTDVGGPTLLHGGCKGRRVVLHSPLQFADVLDYLRTEPTEAPIDDPFLQLLTVSAERAAEEHIRLSADYHEGLLDPKYNAFLERWGTPVKLPVY